MTEIQFKVEDSTVYYRQSGTTDVYTSRNGYQWTGFTLRTYDDVEKLRDLLNVRLTELEERSMAEFVKHNEGGSPQEE